MEGWGRGQWGLRGGHRVGDRFIDCVRVFAFVLGSWAVAVVVRALQDEMLKTYQGAARPWLYEGIRRTDHYAHWHFPPLLELYKTVRKAMRSSAAERAELQRAILQMRVLTQIRGGNRGAREAAKYIWALELDEDLAVLENKRCCREMRKVSRRLALHKREFAQRCAGLEANLGELSEKMMDGLDILMETDFVHAHLVWPRAQPGFSALAAASRRVEAEIAANKKVVLKIPMKRIATIDKQLAMAEKLIDELTQTALEEELDKAEAQQKDANNSLTLADRDTIFQTM